jgi:hypothetical protein
VRATDDPNYHNEWYHRNKHRLAEARRIRNRNEYRSRSAYILHRKLAIGRCGDCGLQCTEQNHPVFEFDHRDPETKAFDIANGKKRPFRDLKAEIDKCDMVCANCHRLRTIASQAWKNRRDDSDPDDPSQPSLFEETPT